MGWNVNHGVSHHFTEQFLGCKVFDLANLAIAIKPIVEMNTVSHFFSQYHTFLLCNTSGYRNSCNSSRLRVIPYVDSYLCTRDASTSVSPSRFHQELRNLCRFSTTRFSLDNSNMASFDRITNVVIGHHTENIQNFSPIWINGEISSLFNYKKRPISHTCCSILIRVCESLIM